MKRTPRYTPADLARFHRPYVKSESTDITKTWAEARKRLEANKVERERIVTKLQPLGRKKA